MEIYLIRHGEMVGDPHQRFEAGAAVTGCLSEKGCEQAERLGKRLEEVEFDAVYASPLGRAVQTSQVLRRRTGVGIEIMDWLIEWRPATVMGECAEGAAYEEMMAKAALVRPEMAWKTGAGEGTLEMAHRIVPGFLRLMERHGVRAGHGGYLMDREEDEQKVALVAHGGSLGMLAGFLLGVPIRPYGPVGFEQTGVGVFGFVKRVDVWYAVMRVM